mgnify:CR=1 FL=1
MPEDLEDWDDADLRGELSDIDDDDDISVTKWESEFIETVVFTHASRSLSDRQRQSAIEIIKK